MDEILSGRSASNPRNKQIASIFKEAGIIEKYGSGIRRVRQIMQSAGAREPVFEIIGNLFKVTLFPVKTRVNGGVNGGVNDLLEYIQSNPGKKSADLKAVFNPSQRTLERWLKQLKGENKIEFRGPPKTGGYFAK
jgi:ATP-dependent DNA helicase RecG